MSRFVVLLFSLLFSMASAYAEDAHHNHGSAPLGLEENEFFKAVGVGLWNEADYNLNTTLTDGGKVRLTLRKVGQIKFDGYFNKVSFLNDHQPIQDFTGDGLPELAFQALSGEDCCYQIYVFSLGEEFKKLGVYDSGYQAGTLEPVSADHDPLPPELANLKSSLMVVHHHFGDFWGLPNDQVMAAIQLKYAEDAFIYASDLMQLRRPRWQSYMFDRIGSNIKARADVNFVYHDDEHEYLYAESYLKAALPPILSFIHAGHADQSYELLKSSWPGAEAAREQFWKDIWQEIDSKPFAKDIRALNKAYEDAIPQQTD